MHLAGLLCQRPERRSNRKSPIRRTIAALYGDASRPDCAQDSARLAIPDKRLTPDIVAPHVTLTLQDSARLAISGKRLARCRRELERAYGKDLTRLRAIHSGSASVESATFLRLCVLEGLLARYTGDTAAAAKAAAAADVHAKRLAVSDAALAALQGMGFENKLAARALRFCAGDVAKAADFCMEQRAAKRARQAQDERSMQLTDQQRELGKTEGGAWIDVDAVQRMEEMGHPMLLAAEALRCVFRQNSVR